MDNFVGKRLDGRYEMQDIIGVGGMAVVYKAYDSIDDRIVAVKILKEEYLANEEFRRRFKNESKAIAILSHPNIVKVYDVSFGDRLQYIVMEYIEGITLKEYIEQQKCIDWNEALYFVVQILRALQHAHDKGIVHRDVKPQNIMLLEDGTIKVADFGIARFSRGETRTMTEKAIGSVHYISPEQAKGEMTDEKADIYSVGVVLYEMLTGKLPFEADSAVSVALMQLQNEAVPPRSINPNIPAGFEQITMKAMQKNTRDRYQTAAEMLLDLEELKRNPNIKFDYTVFTTDSAAGFYIGKIQEKRQDYSSQQKTKDNTPELKGQGASSAEVADAQKKLAQVNEGKTAVTVLEDVDKPKINNKMVAILIAVVFGVIAIVGVIIAILVSNDTISFTGKKIEVENFVGHNYLDVIQNEDYKDIYNFELVEVSFSDAEEGSVYQQDPKAGEKITKGGTVKLYVVSSGEKITIPYDLEGSNYKNAADDLRAMGFNVQLNPQTSSDYTVGTVISVDPTPGSEVIYGSTVTLTFATDKSSELFKMPSVEGKTLEEAKNILLDKGLVIDDVKTQDSPKPENTVIQQGTSAGSPVEKGDAVVLVVSTGLVAGEKTITLPKSGGILSVRVTVDGEIADSCDVDTSTTTSYKFKIKIRSGKSPVCVYVNDNLYKEMIASLTKSKVSFTDEKTHVLNFYVDVTNLMENEAVAQLKSAGYTKYTVVYQESDYAEGTVISQSPDCASYPQLKNDTTIVLTVSKGLNVEPTEIETETTTSEGDLLTDE